jgi:HK97 family phage major capsid protein
MQSRGVDAGTLAAAVTKATGLKAQLDRAKGDANMTAAIDRITGGMNGNGGGRGLPSLGQQFIDSEAGQYLIKNRGKFPTGQWTSPASELMAAVLSEDAASGGDLVITDYQRDILGLPMRPPRIEDLIAPGQTDSNTIGYMKETQATNAADSVAEGAPKPESTLIFDAVTDPVRKIPTWIPVTDEMLEDVPTMRSYIDARLRLFVNLALDDQLLNGSTTAPDIIGFLNRTGLATAVVRAGSVTNADAVLDQITAIESATFMPVDGIVMHPTNWKTIQQSKDGNGQYYGGGPLASPARPVLWGRPVAVTSAIALGTALVGAFRMGSQLFNRGGMRVEASNSHSDFFTRNLVAIRAERRAALAVYRPSAFGTVTSLT